MVISELFLMILLLWSCRRKYLACCIILPLTGLSGGGCAAPGKQASGDLLIPGVTDINNTIPRSPSHRIASSFTFTNPSTAATTIYVDLTDVSYTPSLSNCTTATRTKAARKEHMGRR